MKSKLVLINQIIEFHPSIPDRVISRESGVLEFKESFNWGSNDSYAKSLAAFANNKGGYLVFGISNHPRFLKGLLTSNFEDVDEEKITSYLNSVFSPEIAYNKSVIEINSKKIGVLQVFQSKNRPVTCIKNDGELKESDIYYRYIARSERIKYPDLKALLDQIKDKERKSWMEHFEKISKVGPMNAAVLDVIGGEITGSTGTLVIDKKLIPKLKFISEGNFREGGRPVLKLIGDVKPVSVVTSKNKRMVVGESVQITSDPNAPAVRFDEKDILKKYALSYADLTNKLRERYYRFKTDKKYHRIRKRLITDNKFALTRYLDPNNPKGTKKVFYSLMIVKEFDKHYKRSRKRKLVK